jgi:hypothetical protein
LPDANEKKIDDLTAQNYCQTSQFIITQQAIIFVSIIYKHDGMSADVERRKNITKVACLILY